MNDFVLELKVINPFKVSYVFLDTKDEYVLKKLNEELKINKFKSYSKKGNNLNVTIVFFAKKNKDKFLELMDRIYKNLLLLGYEEEELNILNTISNEI
ncbi:hypothetical protein [Peptoniphilus phoceensis]|uniref:hypothetical protein n=1 Tax=Peptoniphilus phoceensis TaxID=1720298 RepID=UPI000780E93E|nr:hypothetical protein [Peptoniphilus phoceensis]